MRYRVNNLDEDINIKSSFKIQRSIQVPSDIWEASKRIPGGRIRFIVDVLANARSGYQTKLPNLRIEVDDLQAEIYHLESVKSVPLQKIQKKYVNL